MTAPKRLLIVNGCSHTAGDELAETDVFGRESGDIGLRSALMERDPAAYRRLTEIERSRCWAAHLARLEGIGDLENLASGGASIARMVRTSITHITRHLSHGADPSEMLVVLQWPEPSRIERFYDGSFRSFLVRIPEHYGPPHTDYLRRYRDVYQDYVADGIAYVQSVILMQSFLTGNGIDFIMCEAARFLYDLDMMRTLEARSPDFVVLRSAIDRSRWPERTLYMCHNEAIAPLLPRGHAPEVTHMAFAQHIHRHRMSRDK